MSKNGNIGQLEALLFFHGEAISEKKIASFLDLKGKEAKALLDRYEKVLRTREDGGLQLLRDGAKAQLVTREGNKEISKQLVKEDLKEELTPASLETLAIISYLGPLSRPEIDYIRGVNSSFMLRHLILRGLVERVSGVKKSHGAHAYQVSFAFLKHMGLEKVEKLPEYEKYTDLLERMREQEVEKV